MSYEKQNFEDGYILYADNLNKTQDAIVQNESNIKSLQETVVNLNNQITNLQKVTLYNLHIYKFNTSDTTTATITIPRCKSAEGTRFNALIWGSANADSYLVPITINYYDASSDIEKTFTPLGEYKETLTVESTIPKAENNYNITLTFSGLQQWGKYQLLTVDAET